MFKKLTGTVSDQLHHHTPAAILEANAGVSDSAPSRRRATSSGGCMETAATSDLVPVQSTDGGRGLRVRRQVSTVPVPVTELDSFPELFDLIFVRSMDRI